MEYYLPVYTTVNPATRRACDAAAPEFQRAFTDALRVGMCFEFDEKLLNAYKNEHAKATWKNAVAFVMLVCEILDIRDAQDARNPTLQKWFGNSLFTNKKHYVALNGLWYECSWKRHTVKKKPKVDRAVVYWRNEPGKTKMVDSLPTMVYTTGVTLLYNDKKKGDVTHVLDKAKLFEKKSQQIIKDRMRFMKRYDQRKTTDDHLKHLEHVQKIEDQNIRDRGVYVNDAIKEILAVTHLMTIMGPINRNERIYFDKHGMNDLYDRLDLIGFQTRNEDVPIHVSIYDPRFMQPLYEDTETNKHTTLARLLLGPMKYFAEGRKTVK